MEEDGAVGSMIAAGRAARHRVVPRAERGPRDVPWSAARRRSDTAPRPIVPAHGGAWLQDPMCRRARARNIGALEPRGPWAPA